MVQCKACKAQIRFVNMETGGMMPVDAKPLKMIELIEEIGAMAQGRMITVYMPHWSTCPEAGRFKKKPKA